MNRPGPRCTKDYRPWTAAELDLLSEAWVRGGVKAARQVLPDRSDDSLKGKACALQLIVAGRKKYTKYPPSEFVDAAIKRAYAQGRPDLIALEKSLQRPRGWIKYRAGALGMRCEATGIPQAPWLDAEDKILTEGSDRGFAVTTMHKQLAKAGHRRSLSAVSCRLQTLGLNFNRNGWSANQVAALFDLDSHVVLRWIDLGWLPAKRQAGVSALVEPEEQRKMWIVKPQAVRDFMLKYPEKWDHRRVRKEVLLDLLCPERFNTMALKESA